jgi:DNA-binding NtrC family response regulator
VHDLTDPSAGLTDGPVREVIVAVAGERVVHFPMPAHGAITIGRSSECDLVIDDPSLSRTHARLRSGPRTIEDLGSTHGCRVRGEALRPGEQVAFELGEPLLVGRVTIVVQQRAFADEATATLEAEDTGDQAWLVVAVAGKAISHPLRLGRTITIGRSSTCDVVIDDASVSRVHASLSVGAQPMLEDRGSSTGTRIGERTITSAPIAFGEAFQLGGVTLILQRRGAPAKPAEQTDGMERVRDLAARVAPGRVSVLVVGESGVGKEYLAELIHQLSPRRDGPLVKLNCGALSENLVEAELFGYEKGAFTGAVAAKAGLIEAAAGGTVFLDEIGELPPNQQVKLLRAIEERKIRRVGGVVEIAVDVRFVSATNRELEDEAVHGRFRLDLFYRLAAVSLRIPPLRERRAEILPLALRFRDAAARDMNAEPPSLAPAAERWLATHAWPGNIRELRNTMERAVLLSGGRTIEVEHLHDPGQRRSQEAIAPAPLRPGVVRDEVKEAVQAVERKRMLEALDQTGGNQTRAAELLGMSRRAFVDRLDAYGIKRPRKK